MAERLDRTVVVWIRSGRFTRASGKVGVNENDSTRRSRGTDGSNPVPSSGESANFQFLARCDCDGETRFIALAYRKFESSSLQR
jgi:hypothetical protein